MTDEKCNCASGTTHNDGERILAAVREQWADGRGEGYWRQKAARLLEDLDDAIAERKVYEQDFKAEEEHAADLEADVERLNQENVALETRAVDAEQMLAEALAEIAALYAFL